MNARRHMLAHPRLLVGLGLWMALAVTQPLPAQDVPAAESQQIRVLPLKHTSAIDVMQVIRQVTQGSGVDVAADAQSNALIVKAADGALDEVKRVVGELDIETGTERQVKVFQLQHIATGPDLENMLATITEGDVRFAMNGARNVVVATGSEQALGVVEALLTRLDTKAADAPAARPAAREMRLRLVWLVGGLADDAAAVPPPDLEGVAQELAKMGVTNLTMAAQLMVNVTEGAKFSASGSAKVNEPCMVECAGTLGDIGPPGLCPSEQPSLRLEITATARAGESAHPLCHLQTTTKAPLGQSVVLGIAPVDSKPAVFVVQMLPRIEVPADAKKD